MEDSDTISDESAMTSAALEAIRANWIAQLQELFPRIDTPHLSGLEALASTMSRMQRAIGQINDAGTGLAVYEPLLVNPIPDAVRDNLSSIRSAVDRIARDFYDLGGFSSTIREALRPLEHAAKELADFDTGISSPALPAVEQAMAGFQRVLYPVLEDVRSVTQEFVLSPFDVSLVTRLAELRIATATDLQVDSMEALRKAFAASTHSEDVVDTVSSGEEADLLASIEMWLRRILEALPPGTAITKKLLGVIFDAVLNAVVSFYLIPLLPLIAQLSGVQVDMQQVEHEERPQIVQSAEQQTMIATANVRMRAEPSTEAHILTTLAPNQTVTLLRKEGRWSYVTFYDHLEGLPRTGWVSSRYLKAVSE